MKTLTFKIAVALMALNLAAKAQHTMGDTHHEIAPPKVIFKKIVNAPDLTNKEVTIVIVDFKPGEVSSAHRHPMATFGYVLEGELESTFEGKVYRYKKGDAFFEEPNGLHQGTRNVSKTRPAKLLAYFVGDPGKPVLIPEKK